MNDLKGNQRLYWVVGVTLVIGGVLVSALVLPGLRKQDPGPDVHVPNMHNVPPADQKLKLDVEKQP